ncbi:alpha/beta hydrolase family protein [Dactylosporangium fulvum]|uniref:Alpha/beta hydrolase family protein n=1 Tax=Dactylosporangium fulvum TaxID=53359 RepID=A0ABY5VRL9_9ACTN|nr:alpha/beta hydrolase family protein [Dactylosporangium fulvum]UWP79454.1 alpha/beta hydrolase family protein [Dactylosporangium fulvum]
MRMLLALPCIALCWTVLGPTHAAPVPPPLAVQSGRYADGRALEVVGDVAAARTVVVLVPGVNTTAADFDRGLGGVERRAPAWQARRLYAEIGSADVAVVAWLGYDPPEGLGLAAVREDRAAAGALALRRFLPTLPGTRIVLVGHSYGSTVIGIAAAKPGLDARVTDIVALGSPGMGVDRAADLRAAARVWAASAPNDWTRRLPGLRILGVGHGTHPADPEFGALALPVDGVDGHDGYFVAGTGTLHALAGIVDGRA